MKTEYLPAFLKDLKALIGNPVYDKVKRLAFETLPAISNLNEVRNLKRLRGADNAYRIRVGDYRVGFIFEHDTIVFARVLNRKELYRYFP